MNPFLKKYHEVNAFGRALGLDLQVVKPGEVVYTMTIAEAHLSNPYAAHGGAVAAMMDAVLGVAALSLSTENRQLVSTVEFKINYFYPVALHDQLEGRGRVIFSGHRFISSEGEIFQLGKSNKLISKGLGTFNVYPIDRNPLFRDLPFDPAPDL